jgi:hypothetical protein
MYLSKNKVIWLINRMDLHLKNAMNYQLSFPVTFCGCSGLVIRCQDISNKVILTI